MASVGGSPRGVPEQLRCRVSTKGAAGCTAPGRLSRTPVSVLETETLRQLATAAPSIPGTEVWGWSWVHVSGSITWGKTLEITFWLNVSLL